MYPSDLTDSQWQNIKENFDVKILRRKRKYTIRQIINAILYVDKSGIQWRMLPNDFPDWRIVYYYFRKWAQDGTVVSIHNSMAIKVRLALGKEASPSLGLIDSQSVKSMSVTPFKGFDGNKKVNGRKRFIIVDTLGFIMGLVITTANIGERAGAELVMAKLGNRFSRLTKILADQGFDGVDFIAKMVNTFKIQWEIVVQVLGLKGFSVLPKRWIVERTFGWFAFHRRLTKDYEVNVSHSEAFIYWTMIRIMSRRTRET
jgi:putative transposase